MCNCKAVLNHIISSPVARGISEQVLFYSDFTVTGTEDIYSNMCCSLRITQPKLLSVGS